MPPTKTALCSNCRSHLDNFVAEATLAKSELSELLQRNRANDIPKTPAERSQMKLILDEAQGDLGWCDQAISDLDKQLAKLKKCRRDILRKRIAPRQSLLSPIRRLPPEILILIFTNLDLLVAHNYLFFWQNRLESEIFALTWVCTQWRELVLSQSQLWARFKVELALFHEIPTQFLNFAIECFKVRSGTAQVSFTLVGYSDTPFTLPILDVIPRAVERWKAARFEAATAKKFVEFLLERYFGPGVTTFPYLESFALLANEAEKSKVFELIRSLRHCPRLRHLSVSHLDPSVTFTVMTNLTSLELRDFAGHCLTQLLKQCPSLKQLTVRNFTQVQVPTADYCHTRLSQLNIEKAKGGLGTEWSSGLRLPALTHLLFNYQSESWSEALQELANLLLRSKCSLTQIQLTKNYIADSDASAKAKFLSDVSSVIAPDARIDF
ncbi:hypothetical protein D9757_012248 [Collybiopsis confluens]|uniref:F-box domain-containing protein n=1 Tax=Collybiopsis confluens TaxID=2823264 RepID=A0A8H5G5C3_9AGAR|nr:hypothetical protein D9757_012248 [Collybiopsis confluens]